MRSATSRVRFQSARETQTSLGTFGDSVATKLDPAEGEPGFNYRDLFQDVGARIASVQEQLVDAEDAHVRNQIQISDLKREGERLNVALYDEQVSVRRILEGAYGSGRGFELAAVKGSTPQGLDNLSDQVDQTVKLLRDPAIEAPSVKAGGVAIDFAAMAESLETGRAEIVRVGELLASARKAADQTVIEKRKATAAFDAVFPWAAQTVEGVFRMAGERDLADRIRTARQRVTRNQGVEETETAEPADPAAGEPAAGAPAAGDPQPEHVAPSRVAADVEQPSSDS